jgi:hypothetical protein
MLLEKYFCGNPDPILQQLEFCTKAMHAPRLARAFFFGLMVDDGRELDGAYDVLLI